MNNRGFMMAEVVVVSAIILTFLVSMYMSYNKLYSSYKTRINYYDTVTLYRLGYYRDYLIDVDSNNLNQLLVNYRYQYIGNGIEYPMGTISSLSSNDNEMVFLIYNHSKNIPSNILNNYTINETFKEYVDYIAKGVNLSHTNAVMIMERCLNRNNNNCRYAYLEVNDGYE